LTDLLVSLKTDSMALARVEAVTEQHVTISINGADKWNAEGLLKLAAMLKGVAATMVATTLLFGFMMVADATSWSPWNAEAEAYNYSGN
jgi:hypothetical protein